MPQEMQQKVLQRAHGDQHSGVVHMKKALSLYWWKTKEVDVSKFVAACVCAVQKDGRPPKVPYKTQEKAKKPNDLLIMDTYQYDGEKYLTMVDSYSGFPFAYHLEEDERKLSERVLEMFDVHCALHGRPRRVRCDNGLEFVLIKGIPMMHGPAYHPESQGMVERMHREARLHGVKPDRAIRYLQSC